MKRIWNAKWFIIFLTILMTLILYSIIPCLVPYSFCDPGDGIPITRYFRHHALNFEGLIQIGDQVFLKTSDKDILKIDAGGVETCYHLDMFTHPFWGTQEEGFCVYEYDDGTVYLYHADGTYAGQCDGTAFEQLSWSQELDVNGTVFRISQKLGGLVYEVNTYDQQNPAYEQTILSSLSKSSGTIISVAVYLAFIPLLFLTRKQALGSC